MRLIESTLALVLLLSPCALHASDPFLGRWSLDVQRSKYSAGSCPKQMTIDMNNTERGVHYHSETVLMNGNSIRADYTAEYDGQPVVVMGAKGMLLPVALKRVKPNTVLAIYGNAFKVAATSRRVISADEKVMTITTISRDSSNKVVTNVGVYKRVKPRSKPGFDLLKVNTLLP